MLKNVVLSKEDLFHIAFDRTSGLGLNGCGGAEEEIRQQTKRCKTAQEVYEKVDVGYKTWLAQRVLGHQPVNDFQNIKPTPYSGKFDHKRGDKKGLVNWAKYEKTVAAMANRRLPWRKIQNVLLNGIAGDE
jgi:hypothetical protein